MTNLILVVDDDALTRLQLRTLLQQEGYQVAEAINTEQALYLYIKLQPNIVLLDALMPMMNGISCCDQLQTLAGATEIPILIMSDPNESASMETDGGAGAIDYITKPIKWQVLRQRVRRLLEAHHAIQKLQQQTEQAQSREAQLVMALEAASMITWDWDILNNKLTWPDNLKPLFGLESATYDAFVERVHPQDRDFVNRSVMQTLQEGTEYDIEFRVVWHNGMVCWIASKGVVFRDSSGVAVRMTGIGMDITKRKQSEEALEVYAKRQALVAELSQVALGGVDLTTLMDETVALVAQSLKVEYCKVLELCSDNNTLLLRAGVGWEPGLVGYATVSAGMDSQAGYTLSSQEPVIVDDLGTEERFNGPPLLHKHQVVSGLSVIIHGKERPFGVLGAHSTTQRTFSKDDIYFLQAIANMLATAIERQKVEDALRESEQRWQLALRGNNDGIWDWNVKTNQVFFSTRWKQMLGYSEHEIPNHFDEWMNRVHPDDMISVTRVIQDHFTKKTPFYISEYRIRCKNGSYKWILDRGQALWDDQGTVVRMAGSHTDITERKLADEKLQESENRFQILARATNDAVWDWDLLTNKLWWNDNVQTLFGYSTQQVKSEVSWWHEHIHPDDRNRIISDIDAVINSNQHFWSNEYRFRRVDNSYAYIFERGYVVHDNTGKSVRMIAAMIDFSERKRVQQELQRQNLRSQLFANISLKIRQSLQINEILQTSVTEVQKLLQSDRVLIFRLLPHGSGVVMQEAVVPGVPAVVGQNIHDPCFVEDYVQKYRNGRISAVTDIEQGGIEPCYIEFLKKLNVRSNLIVPILLKNQLWGLLIAHQCICPRQWTNWETELLRHLADQMGIALAQAQLLEQETRHSQELIRSNDELQQFAFVASHDLQEPLRKIKTFGDRLKATCGHALTEQGLDYLERMQNATRRMQALIEDLLTLSRVTTRGQPFVPVNLTQITKEVLSDLEVRIQQTQAYVEVGELPIIHADPLQMRQLLQNLIGNALKFCCKEEPPIVKIYNQILNQQDVVQVCQIIVEDHGIGFDEKYLDRIFNVFQRLHGRSEYEGTGIGLAICRKIVERHNGSISAQSTPGQGSKFLILLPMHPPA
ncbi:PAS domain-containing protein [Brasilonema octagenarum]|uniref:histidine kinase n=1 Tax=Brasilonema octagenarum UFV-OR1 TaxID=417115 RepID=A0ABX1M9A1_9CYAN|nr:PAS domain-containing protein [Brasilonema octagenarum]NMF65149.1 histidine kinase [Brasilonema octagenarum UFV-OR1]